MNRAAGELRGLRGAEFLCSRRPDASLPGVFVPVTESEELEATAFYYASSVFSFSSPSLGRSLATKLAPVFCFHQPEAVKLQIKMLVVVSSVGVV